MSLNMFWINALIIKGSMLVLFFLLLLSFDYQLPLQSNFRNINRVERLLWLFVFVLWLFVLFCAITVQSIIT